MKWTQYLALVEWWYNINYYTSAKLTPFQLLYGYPPPIYLPYVLGDSSNAAMDELSTNREEVLKMLRFHLRRAQNRMVQLANKKRTDQGFEIGDFVLLKLQPYRQ